MKALAKSPELAAKVRKHWREAQRLGRLAVEEAWLCGRALNQLKAAQSHGEFLPTLADLDIPKRTAQRMMRLATDIKCDKLTHLDSVAAALRSLPAPESPAKRAPEAPASDVPTDTQPDSGSNPVAALEASLDDVRAEKEDLAEKNALLIAQLDPKQLDQLDGLRAQIATLKSQVNSWQSKCNDAKRSRDWWKRKAKALETQLALTG